MAVRFPTGPMVPPFSWKMKRWCLRNYGSEPTGTGFGFGGDAWTVEYIEVRGKRLTDDEIVQIYNS